MDADMVGAVRAVVRDIAATAKALRLYPPASPIPRETAASAQETLSSVFDMVPVLSLGITKEGFALSGDAVEQAVAGSDLAGTLQSHGVGEVSFTPGCDADSLLTFLALVVREPEDITAEGGLSALLAASNAVGISLSDVHLTVVEGPLPDEGEDVDEFLRRLAQDPDKLTTWLGTAARGDLNTLRDSLEELARSAGATGSSGLVDALSQAFLAQEAAGRDAIIGVALEEGPVRDLAAGLFSRLSANDVADSLCGGEYGKNMLSLSTVMTSLPIGERFAAVMAQVREALPEHGHADKELGFLQHMIETRKASVPEPALDQAPDYQQVAERATVRQEEFDAARAEFSDADVVARRRTLATLLSLLDQQTDYDLYRQTLESLAAHVPRLIEAGELDLAASALAEVAEREERADLPWPEIADRFREARARATGGAAMGNLLKAVAGDEELIPHAHSILNVAGDTAPMTLVEEALSARDFDGLAVAEQILGRRMNDLLPALAPHVQWFQVAVLTTRLADQGGDRSQQALATLAARPEDQARREVAKGLAQSSNPAILAPLGQLLADPSTEVAVTAGRALASAAVSGAAKVVTDRLEEMDVDGKDFALARELIAVLARMPEPEAEQYLARLANRKALIKRGHFAEVQDLARRALRARQDGEGS